MKTTGANPAAPTLASTFDLLELHLCRSQADLEANVLQQLRSALADVDFAVALATGRELQVRGAGGPRGRWRAGGRCAPDADDTAVVMPVRYGAHDLGCLLLDRALPTALARATQHLLDHYGTALANLTFGAEHRSSSERYAASLQVFEEGIVLFQESDLDTVTARLLSLAVRMASAQAGALFALNRAGDTDSPLELRLTHGMPETLLSAIAAADGGDWPRQFLARSTFHARRDDAPALGGLDVESVPAIIDSVLSLPLRYDGIDCGLVVLFNSGADADTRRDLLERMPIFGRLGAAVLHRFHIEAIAATQRSLQRELQIAAAIQERLLPTRAPDLPRLEFAWHSVSANNIGGDYLDFVVSDLGDLHAIIADASGHGINSALLMSSFRSTYRAEAPWVDPAALCHHLNAAVEHEVGATGMFITAATLRIDNGSNLMTVTSAGHNAVLLYRAATAEVLVIDAHGPPLGFAAAVDYGTERHQLASGDVLLLYTDGITEATGGDGEMFGDDRLRATLRANAALGANELLQRILAALAAFTGRNRYDDDVSVSIVRVR